MSVRLEHLIREFNTRRLRYLMIGVAGVNFYAARASVLFTTKDTDLFLPRDSHNLLSAWKACEELELDLSSSNEPLDEPRDMWLAERVVANRSLTTATDGEDLQLDLTLTMAGFEFEDVWPHRRVFRLEGQELPVAQLEHIVRSKAAAGRPKDHLFLATHREALRDLLPKRSPSDPSGAPDSA